VRLCDPGVFGLSGPSHHATEGEVLQPARRLVPLVVIHYYSPRSLKAPSSTSEPCLSHTELCSPRRKKIISHEKTHQLSIRAKYFYFEIMNFSDYPYLEIFSFRAKLCLHFEGRYFSLHFQIFAQKCPSSADSPPIWLTTFLSQISNLNFI